MFAGRIYIPRLQSPSLVCGTGVTRRGRGRGRGQRGRGGRAARARRGRGASGVTRAEEERLEDLQRSRREVTEVYIQKIILQKITESLPVKRQGRC